MAAALALLRARQTHQPFSRRLFATSASRPAIKISEKIDIWRAWQSAVALPGLKWTYRKSAPEVSDRTCRATPMSGWPTARDFPERERSRVEVTLERYRPHPTDRRARSDQDIYAPAKPIAVRPRSEKARSLAKRTPDLTSHSPF